MVMAASDLSKMPPTYIATAGMDVGFFVDPKARAATEAIAVAIGEPI
jgi:hypothetical protein